MIRWARRDPDRFDLQTTYALCFVGFGLLAAAHAWFLHVPCHIKLMTGIPCPTCGATRVARSLLAGEIAKAFSYNPMVAAASILIGLYTGYILLARLVDWPRPVLTLQRDTFRQCLLAGVGLGLINWGYLIWAGI